MKITPEMVQVGARALVEVIFEDEPKKPDLDKLWKDLGSHGRKTYLADSRAVLRAALPLLKQQANLPVNLGKTTEFEFTEEDAKACQEQIAAWEKGK